MFAPIFLNFFRTLLVTLSLIIAGSNLSAVGFSPTAWLTSIKNSTTALIQNARETINNRIQQTQTSIHATAQTARNGFSQRAEQLYIRLGLIEEDTEQDVLEAHNANAPIVDQNNNENTTITSINTNTRNQENNNQENNTLENSSIENSNILETEISDNLETEIINNIPVSHENSHPETAATINTLQEEPVTVLFPDNGFTQDSAELIQELDQEAFAPAKLTQESTQEDNQEITPGLTREPTQELTHEEYQETLPLEESTQALTQALTQAHDQDLTPELTPQQAEEQDQELIVESAEGPEIESPETSITQNLLAQHQQQTTIRNRRAPARNNRSSGYSREVQELIEQNCFHQISRQSLEEILQETPGVRTRAQRKSAARRV